MRNALPENSAPGLSESVLTLETSRPPVWPVPEYEYIGTQFGAGHRGTDIAAREGAEILAVWDGTVLEAEYHENWGDYVLLDQMCIRDRWAGTVKVFMPRGYSLPRGSSSLSAMPTATRLPGQTFFRHMVRSRMRPCPSMTVSPM